MKLVLGVLLFTFNSWSAQPQLQTCEDAVLIHESGLIFQSHNNLNTKSIIAGLLDYLRSYKILPTDEEGDPLFAALGAVELQFRPLFRKQIESFGWKISEIERSGLHHFNIPREDLIKTFPILAPLLADDVAYAFAPSFQIPWRANAFYSATDTTIGLPLNLLYEDPDFETAQAVVHEIVHHYLEKFRRASGLHSFGFTIVPGPKEFDFLSTRVNAYYAANFSSEEILAFLVNALNAYEMECAGVVLREKTNFRAHFLNSWPALVTYLGVILPKILKNQSEGDFLDDTLGLFYVTPDKSYRVHLQSSESELAQLSSEEIRREMNRAFMKESEILLGLHEVYNDFTRITGGHVSTERCRATGPVWDYLEKIGFPRSQFRIIRR